MDRQELHILLIEDDKDHAELISDSFARTSMQVRLTVARTLHEARTCLTDALPDLVIADMLLPDGSGTEILEGSSEGVSFPVVIMTGYGNEQAAVDALKKGALDYVAKSEETLNDISHVAHRALREWALMAERRQAERSLERAYGYLETRVQQRTSELESVNQRLSEQIRDRNKAEQRVEKLREEIAHMARLTAMGELAAGVAHELNQPLASIATWAEVTAHELEHGRSRGQDDLKQVLGRIADEAHRSSAIIRRFRQFARKSPPSRAGCDIEVIALETRELLQHDLRQTPVECVMDFSEELPKVYADKIQVQQVLLNLMQNALEAMEPNCETKQKLRVRVKTRDGMVEVSVQDSGCGLPHDIHQQLFDPFFTTKPDGIGMGLAVSRSIVEAHDGHISAEPSVGRGATFRFTLPIVREEQQRGE